MFFLLIQLPILVLFFLHWLWTRCILNFKPSVWNCVCVWRDSSGLRRCLCKELFQVEIMAPQNDFQAVLIAGKTHICLSLCLLSGYTLWSVVLRNTRWHFRLQAQPSHSSLTSCCLHWGGPIALIESEIRMRLCFQVDSTVSCSRSPGRRTSGRNARTFCLSTFTPHY